MGPVSEYTFGGVADDHVIHASFGASTYRHTAAWDGEGLSGRAPAGIYFARYRAGGVTSVKRILLTR